MSGIDLLIWLSAWQQISVFPKNVYSLKEVIDEHMMRHAEGVTGVKTGHQGIKVPLCIFKGCNIAKYNVPSVQKQAFSSGLPKLLHRHTTYAIHSRMYTLMEFVRICCKELLTQKKSRWQLDEVKKLGLWSLRHVGLRCSSLSQSYARFNMHALNTATILLGSGPTWRTSAI